MMGSENWGEMQRWTREAHVSKVWGPPRSGINISPDSEEERVFCWKNAGEDDWQSSRRHLHAFLDVLQHWSGCPDILRSHDCANATATEYARLQEVAIEFYVRTFIGRVQRLPIPPVHDPGYVRPVPTLDTSANISHGMEGSGVTGASSIDVAELSGIGT